MSIDYRPVRPSIARHVFLCSQSVFTLFFSFCYVSDAGWSQNLCGIVSHGDVANFIHLASPVLTFVTKHETAARITIATRWFWALLWAKSWTRANRDPSTCRGSKHFICHTLAEPSSGLRESPHSLDEEVYKTRKTHSVYIPLLPKKKCIKKNKKKRRGMAFFFLPFSLYFDKVKIPQWGVSPLPSQKKKNHRRIKYFFLLFFWYSSRDP